MNLLIIDDDKDLLRLLELTFKKEYNVDLCDSAEKIVPEQLVKYNLIILDVIDYVLHITLLKWMDLSFYHDIEN